MIDLRFELGRTAVDRCLKLSSYRCFCLWRAIGRARLVKLCCVVSLCEMSYGNLGKPVHPPPLLPPLQVGTPSRVHRRQPSWRRTACTGTPRHGPSCLTLLRHWRFCRTGTTLPVMWWREDSMACWPGTLSEVSGASVCCC